MQGACIHTFRRHVYPRSSASIRGRIPPLLQGVHLATLRSILRSRGPFHNELRSAQPSAPAGRMNVVDPSGNIPQRQLVLALHSLLIEHFLPVCAHHSQAVLPQERGTTWQRDVHRGTAVCRVRVNRQCLLQIGGLHRDHRAEVIAAGYDAVEVVDFAPTGHLQPAKPVCTVAIPSAMYSGTRPCSHAHRQPPHELHLQFVVEFLEGAEAVA